MQNRDVFSEDYYSFLYEVIHQQTDFMDFHLNLWMIHLKHLFFILSTLFLQLASANSGPVSRNPEEQEQLNTESVKLAIHFLFNTYYHVRKRQRGVMSDWVAAIGKIIEECPGTAHWLVTFLSSDGLRYIKPYLLEGRSRDVRQSFSHLLEKALAAQVNQRFFSFHHHLHPPHIHLHLHLPHHNHQTKHRSGGSGPTTAILTHLVEMLGTEVRHLLLGSAMRI